MSGTGNQARGSISSMLIQKEATYNTAVAAGDRRCHNLHFNSCSLKMAQPLGDVATIRGHRASDEPYRKNRTVEGDSVHPVDSVNFGLLCQAAIGTPTTTEAPSVSHKTGSPTVTIASGVATFSTAQTTAVVGDVVYYSGALSYFYLVTKNTTSEWVVANTADGAGTPADVTGATVSYISASKVATPGTDNITITSGVATLSAAVATLAVGDKITYVRDSTTGVASVCYVYSVTSTTVAVVKTAQGHAPANTSSNVDLESIEAAPRFTHVFKIGATARLSSYLIQQALLDLDTPIYEWCSGCKANTMAINFGGDDELLATVTWLGANETDETTAYDATVPAAEIFGNRFNQFQVAAERAGSAEDVIKTFSININNQLDGDTFTLMGDGQRRSINEGIALVTGNFTALLEDFAIQDVADAGTTTSLEITCTSGSDSVSFYMPECKLEVNKPSVASPAGITYDMNWKAFMTDGQTEQSAIVVTIVNGQPGY